MAKGSKKSKEAQAAPSGAFGFDEFNLSLQDMESGINDFEEMSSHQGSRDNLDNEEMDFDFDDDDMVDFELDNANELMLDGDYNDYVLRDEDQIKSELSKGNLANNLFSDLILGESHDADLYLTNIFDGYNANEKEGLDIKLNSEEIDFFQNLEYEKIAEILSPYDSGTRVKVKEYLLQKKFNILSVIHKEGSSDLRLVYFGLFSPRHVFHTLMCKKAVEERNMELIMTIFSLKPKKIVEEIFESYEKVYQIDLETEINEEFKPMNELILFFIKAEKYFHVVKETEYYAEAGRVFHIIKSRNISGFLNFMVRFKHKCFKGICIEFYIRFGMTVMNFFKKYIGEDDIINMIEILQVSYLTPMFFYCKILNAEITSPKPTLILPYILIDLQYNGLDAVMAHYHLLYDTFNAKKVSQRFEEGVKQYVYQILRKYEISGK